MNTSQTITAPTRRKAGNAKATARRRARRDPVSKAVLRPEALGQVFTPAALVQEMLAMRKNSGRVLEPSCGSGAFSGALSEDAGNLVAIELDASHAPAYARVMDFFDYPESEKFETIIGNPPYLRHQDISAETREKLDFSRFDRRANLYLFFIEKCVRHLAPNGELIFVVPRDFPQATAARKLNRWLYSQGTITHFRETGDNAFVGACPSCCVFRFEKGRMDRTMSDGRTFVESDGQFLFLEAGQANGTPLAELFDVAVGGLTGADDLFVRSDGDLDVVYSKTAATGRTRKMLSDNQAHNMLLSHKPRLMARGVRSFSEGNWWQWGRSWRKCAAPRIYVNMKTRKAQPFFTHSCTNYDGSVLALFPLAPGIDTSKVAAILNQVDWDALGFKDGGKFIFGARSLARCILPDKWARQIRAACSAKPEQADGSHNWTLPLLESR